MTPAGAGAGLLRATKTANIRRSSSVSSRTRTPSSTMSALTLRQFPRLANVTSVRSFSVAARRMAEGDTGATRSGGAAQSDSFQKREQANENYYVQQEEKKKLEALRKKIADQEAQLAKDRKEADDILTKSK